MRSRVTWIWHRTQSWRGIALGIATAVLVLQSVVPTFGAPTPQAQPTPVSPQPTPVSPQPTPVPRVPSFFDVDPVFRAYYDTHDGFRLLGRAISRPHILTGRLVQYFEKGRMEDHRGESPDPAFQFQYGLLVDELIAVRSLAPVGGDVSTVTYATIADEAIEAKRVPVPPGFTPGQPMTVVNGVFIPFSAALSAAPGHVVHPLFWEYITRADLFPGGWLHDIGLPITEPMEAVVTKGPVSGRRIIVQAFQRTILTYDPLNPPDWQVERANVGTDYFRVFPDRVPQ